MDINFADYIGQELNETERDKVNDALESIFNKSDIKEHISRLHPEIFPNHVGIHLDSDGQYKWGVWSYQQIYDGWSEKGWNFYLHKNINKYIDDVKNFYKERDPQFYSFINKI